MTKEELMQALEQNGSASSVLMKELLTVVEAEIQEAAKPTKPLLVTSLNTTQEYSRHEMATHLGITEDQLMQILRGEIATITDERYIMCLAYSAKIENGTYETGFGLLIDGQFGYAVKFVGYVSSNTYSIELAEV